MIAFDANAPLRRNRWARIAFIEDEGQRVVTLACPVLRRGLQLNRLSLPPEKLAQMERRFFGPDAVGIERLAAHERDFLRNLGYLVTPAEEPAPVQFSCRVAGVPAACWRPFSVADSAFVGAWVDGGHPDFYVRDERLGYEVPYWLGGDVVPGHHAARSRDERGALDLAGLGRHYLEHGFVIIRGLVPPALTAAARRYFAALAHNGYLHHEPQDGHHTLFDPPLGLALHQLLTPLVRQIAAEALKPTYSFVTRYLGGAQLAPHTDTDWAEVSLSVAIEHEAPAGGNDTWPLCVVGRGHTAPTRALLQPGDALMFRGRDLTHFREGALLDGHINTAMLLHYVGADHTGPIAPAERSRRT